MRCFVVFVLLVVILEVDALADVRVDGTRCQQCKDLVSMVGAMTSYESRDRIYQTICKSLQGSDSDVCKITFHRMPAEDMCQVIGECSLYSVPELEIPEMELGIDLCAVCKVFSSVAHDFLSDPDKQKLLLMIAKFVCKSVPVVGGVCSSLVDQFGTLLLNIASQIINPKLCTTIGVCSEDMDQLPQNKCELCALSMGVLYDTLQDPALDLRVEAFSKELCKQSTGFNSTCQSFGHEISQSLLPALYALRESDFLKSICQLFATCVQG